jgi:RNA polymerase sigma-70 factor (ECF subfamily)
MTPNLPETDDGLLMRMRSGDEQAFAALYRRRQAAIYRFALHMSGSATVAEDVTQEVFLALIREECGFDPGRGTLSGYLFGIARKMVLRHVERGRSDVALETDVEASRPCAARCWHCPSDTAKWWCCATWRKWITGRPPWCSAAPSARCGPGCIGRARCCWKN